MPIYMPTYHRHESSEDCNRDSYLFRLKRIVKENFCASQVTKYNSPILWMNNESLHLGTFDCLWVGMMPGTYKFSPFAFIKAY